MHTQQNRSPFSKCFGIPLSMIVWLCLVVLWLPRLDSMNLAELRHLSAVIAGVVGFGTFSLLCSWWMHCCDRRDHSPPQKSEDVKCDNCGKGMDMETLMILTEDPNNPGNFVPTCSPCHFKQKANICLDDINTDSRRQTVGTITKG